jgi:hypothetical protein
MGPIIYNAQPGTSDAALYTSSGETAISKIVAANTTVVTPPAAAPVTATATTGGTVLAGTYQAEVTYTNANGETVGSAVASQVTTGSTSTLTVDSPPAATGATGWYAYVTQAGGSTFTRQQTAGSPTAIGTNLVLTAPPTTTGANPPAANTSGTSVTLNLSVHRAISGTVETLASALPVPAGQASSLVEDRLLALEEIVLDPGDSLHGSAGAAASVTVLAFT